VIDNRLVNVRCIYLYIVVSPYVRGFTAYLHLYLYYIVAFGPQIIQLVNS
jgi:hypothetical protein